MNGSETEPPAAPPTSGADTGASAIEYALLIGLIAIAIFVVVTLAGANVRELYSSIATGF